MEPARRAWCRLVALFLLVLASLPVLAGGASADPVTTSAATVPTSTSVPSVPDYSGVHADQVALATAQLQVTIGQDQAALAAAQSGLAQAQSTATADAAALTVAQTTSQTRAAASVAADQAATAATAARVAANLAFLNQRKQLAGVAVELYVGGGSTSDTDTNELQSAQDDAIGGVIISAGVQDIGVRIDHDRQVWLADIAAEAAALKNKADAAAAAAQAAADLVTAQGAAATSAAAVAPAQAAVTSAAAALSAVQASVNAKILAVAGPAPAVPIPAGDTSPTILGPSVISAADLVAWFRSAGYVDATTLPIDGLVNAYLTEGAAEGVRGDVAFAQAMIETGGFDSPDAVQLSNFAGIGHCDSCASGIAFPSPELGVLGQIQLLRTYATPGLTTAELADPLVLTALAPEAQGVRGCCETWQSLTSHWATDPLYGETVLNLYQQMLTYALRRAGAAVPAPAN